MSLAGRRVLLGVSGGIASYKSCFLARLLVEAGAEVHVVLTAGAEAFVGHVTFEALTGTPVIRSLWEPGQALAHVRVPKAVDLIVVAPATAHLLARAAQGLADDLLTTMLLATTAPVLLAPAMNDDMYAHPAVRGNLATLRSRGARIVGPVSGALAEGPSDRPGRMSEPAEIVRHAVRALAGGGPLDGKRVVVSAGPTREAMDPVRFLSNRSSGKMGYACAEAAWQRGADVVLLSGPTALPAPDGMRVERIDTTAALADAVRRELPEADVLIMAAAPADFRPAVSMPVKRPRASGPLTLELAATDDILLGTRDARKPGAVIVGFALETGDAVTKGRDKLARKALDLIVINDALEAGAGFEVDTNRVTLLDRAGGVVEVPLQSKAGVAEAILTAVEHQVDAQTAVSRATT